MKRFRDMVQHIFNPLHVYCRLRDVGLPCGVAARLSGFYERIYRFAGMNSADKAN